VVIGLLNRAAAEAGRTRWRSEKFAAAPPVKTITDPKSSQQGHPLNDEDAQQLERALQAKLVALESWMAELRAAGCRECGSRPDTA
jgi:hypothetical protein